MTAKARATAKATEDYVRANYLDGPGNGCHNRLSRRHFGCTTWAAGQDNGKRLKESGEAL